MVCITGREYDFLVQTDIVNATYMGRYYSLSWLFSLGLQPLERVLELAKFDLVTTDITA